MLSYAELREQARSGDLLLVQGRGWISRLIRVATGHSISHVAMLVWIGETLWVAEMREFAGFRLRPASLWVEDERRRARLIYGSAPRMMASDAVQQAALSYRARPYDYRALLQVWWGQITRRKTGAGLVCSTFVQRVWERLGVEFDRTAAPGDYVFLCGRTVPLLGLEE